MNFTALPSRLTRIWRTRCRSSMTSVGEPASIQSNRILLGRQRAVLRDDGLDELARVERLRVEGQLAGLDLGQVEDLVDQSEQVAAAALDPAERRALLLVERPVHAGEERVGEAEDRVHRRSKLVAHAGEEARLRLARALRATHSSARAADRVLAAPRTVCARRSLVSFRSCARLPNSSRFGTSTRCVKSPFGDPRERALHLPDREDDRPRQHEPEQQCHDHAAPPRSDDDRGEQVAVGVERGASLDHLVARPPR